MTAYYNENDPRACAWLRELIKAGAIAPGDVDERDIRDIRPSELDGYTQCHFFAGIGGWSLALRLAGWSDETPVWTGSCPCQPFSAAGRGAGFTDERHLWPAWFHLITQRGPAVIFGEQVSRIEGLAWWDLVRSDLHAARYTPAGMDLCAACIGAPHIRQRLYWVCDASGAGSWRDPGTISAEKSEAERRLLGEPDEPESAGQIDFLADASGKRLEIQCQQQARVERETIERGRTSDWSDCEWVLCRPVPGDDFPEARPIKPGTLPLVDGLPGRVGLVRGYGNAIVPELARRFIKAYMLF